MEKNKELNWKKWKDAFRKGRRGVALVMTKLVNLGIDVIRVPLFWHFDLVTEFGTRIEVKYASPTNAKGGTGYNYITYTYRISQKELILNDFIILVPKSKEDLFYIIPIKEITSTTISFNPYSKTKSKYEQFRNRWDLLTFT